MRVKVAITLIAASFVVMGFFISAYSQQPQIPTLQVCNKSAVEGDAVVAIESRGTFRVKIKLKCDPTSLPYPDGNLELNINMSDSIVQGTVTGISFEQLTSTGRTSPTVYLSGRCKAGKASGCRFWMMIADNNQKGKTTDVIGFLMFDGSGKRIAYGTGAVVKGDIRVYPSGY